MRQHNWRAGRVSNGPASSKPRDWSVTERWPFTRERVGLSERRQARPFPAAWRCFPRVRWLTSAD